MSDPSLEIISYQCFRQDCGSKKAGGGLCIYVKNCLKATSLDELSSVLEDGFQQQWIKVQCRSLKSLVVCNVYQPPNASVHHCFETLGRHFVDSQLLNLNVIILGDLNCNIISSFSLEANFITGVYINVQPKSAY